MSSLFPAYSASSTRSIEEGAERRWTQNSSFPPHLILDGAKQAIPLDAPISTPVPESKGSKAKKKHSKVVKNINKSYVKPSDASRDASSGLVEESSSLYNHLKKLVFIEDTGLSAERAFCSDVNHDLENQQFGCPDLKNIAKYKRSIEVPLGIHPSVCLELQLSSKKKNRKCLTRYFDVLKKKRNSFISETIVKQKEDIKISLLEVVPLCLPTAELNDTDKALKTGITGFSEDFKLDFNESSNKSEAECDVLTMESSLQSPEVKEIQIKTLSFNKNLKENPENEQLWLDYINFQNDVFSSLSCYKNSSSLESILMEKKLAILEKALKYNPKSVNLMLTKLDLCKNAWDMEKLISLWEQMLFSNPFNLRIWKEYLLFMLSNVNYFTVSKIVKEYSRCITKLVSLHNDEFQSHQSSNILENVLDILSTLCFILRSAGYTERALAIFQALIEFNLCAPASLDNSISYDQWVTFFEPFWDSGVPRFGEDNAVGWGVIVAEKKIYSSKLVNFEDLRIIEDGILNRKYPQWQTWLEFEKLRESFCWLPWRPNPHLDQILDDSEDVDRTVSFEDISELLFRLPSENLKFMLLCKFLRFLGVELHLMECGCFADDSMEARVNSEIIGIISSHLSDITNQERMKDPFKLSEFNQFKNLFAFISNVFQRGKYLLSPKYSNLLSLLQLRYLTQQVIKSSNVVSTHQGLKDFRRLGKNILKDNFNRSCLFLWKEYLLLEWLCHKRKETEEMFENLLMMCTEGYADQQSSGLFDFVRSYIDFFTGIRVFGGEKRKHNSEDFSKIVWVLLHLGSKQKYSKWNKSSWQPSLLLKAVAGFKAEINKQFASIPQNDNFECKCLNSGMFTYVDCSVCLMYLLYFTQGMKPATQAFREAVKVLTSKPEEMSSKSLRSKMEELLFVSYANLLNFHTWNFASPVRALRLFLFEAIERFPCNACLLLLLAKVKRASLIAGDLQRFFHKILTFNLQLAPVTWLYSIASELAVFYSLQVQISSNELCPSNDTGLSPLHNSGLIWKIRSSFEKALQSQNSEFCIYIWRAYCKFEMMLGDTVRLKDIIMRSLQQCAWSKVLYMDAIEYFPHDFKYFLKVMDERQLRIQTPLEEIVLLAEHVTTVDAT